MDDLTQRPWWRWATGMVVRVEGWGGRPVPCGVVVGSGEMARVADEWGTTPRIAELVAKGARVTPDLDSPATVGVLLERLREAAWKSWGDEVSLRWYDAGLVVHVFGAHEPRRVEGLMCGHACIALIRALDDVTGVGRG